VIINEINTDNYPQVLLLTTVLRDGAPLVGLTPEDFRVREDEVDQEPLTVEARLPPLSVVVAIDTSGSMHRRMDETRAAARAFVESLSEQDSAQLLRFAREIETVTPMTTTKATVTDAIDLLNARGDTALYDALHQSLDLLADRRGRKAVVLLSDGVDDDGTGRPLSENTLDDVLARAAEVSIPVYVVGLGTEMDEAVLADVADSTGGVYLNAPDASQLSAVYNSISDQLSGQYAIRYESNLPADGVSRRVDLSALGQQTSRSYAPNTVEGASTPQADIRIDSECTVASALQAETGALEQARDRHESSLITVTDRNNVRSASMGRMTSAIEEANPDRACLRTSLNEAKQLHDTGLIAVTHLNDLRQRLVAKLALTCEAETAIEGQIDCLAFLRDIHRENLITVTARNGLREDAFENLLDTYAATLSTDDALAELGTLHAEDLISITQRNNARTRLLEFEMR
jgi:VWFA-related protein